MTGSELTDADDTFSRLAVRRQLDGSTRKAKSFLIMNPNPTSTSLRSRAEEVLDSHDNMDQHGHGRCAIQRREKIHGDFFGI
eukprot:scaffold421391_cov88-Attheya_sp.AAC.2